MIKAIEAGVIWLNCFGEADMSQPFEGYNNQATVSKPHNMH